MNTFELFKGDRRNSNRRKQSLIESMLDPLALFQAPPQIKEEPIPKRNGVDMNLVGCLITFEGTVQLRGTVHFDPHS